MKNQVCTIAIGIGKPMSTIQLIQKNAKPIFLSQLL